MSEEQEIITSDATLAVLAQVINASGLNLAEALGVLEAAKLALLRSNEERRQCSTTDSSGQS